MVRNYFLILLFLHLFSACSDGGPSDSQNRPNPPKKSTGDLLKAMAFTGDVINVETRLVSYSKKAARVSIIDPIQEKEIWSKNAVGFEFAIALPDLSGVALFAKDSVTVMTQSAEKVFTLNANYGHISVAGKMPAYSLASIDGTLVEVIRSLGAGQWQHQTLNIPWGAIDPNITQPPENEPVLLASSFNDAGTVLTVFSPADGRYAVFTAASVTEPLLVADTWCGGDGAGTPNNATFSSLLWDETRQIFFAGTADARVIAIDPIVPIDPLNDCTPIEQLPVINLGQPLPVNHLSIFPSGLIGVILDSSDQSGTLMNLNFDGANFTKGSIVYEDICEAPLSSMEISGNYIVVMCTYETVLKNPSDTTPAPSQTNIDPRQYVTLDKTTGEVINRVNIDGVASASVAVDPSTQMLYRMQEGAFGTLEIVNLVTGDRRKRVGIYLENILN